MDNDSDIKETTSNKIGKIVFFIKLSLKMLFALGCIFVFIASIIVCFQESWDHIVFALVGLIFLLSIIMITIADIDDEIYVWKYGNDKGDEILKLQKVPFELETQISKIKEPYKYYLFIIWRLFITVLCCLVYLGVVGLIIYWLINVEWIHDLLFEDTIIALIVFAIPIWYLVILIVGLLVEILKWGIVGRSEDWLSENYSGVTMKGHRINKLYQEKIILTTNEYYDKWENEIKNNNNVRLLYPDCTKTFIQLNYRRRYPNKKDEEFNVDIPLFYFKNTYSKDDSRTIIENANLSNGEKVLDGIINAPSITSNDIEKLVSKLKCNWIVRRVNGAIRFHANYCTLNIFFIDKYSSIEDISDLCSSSFLQESFPYGKISIVAYYKEFSTSEFKSLCLHYKNVERFNERLPLILQDLQKWKNWLMGYPYCYFYNYYPKSMSDISFKDEEIREHIYDFKDSSPENRPKCYYDFARYVSIQIKYTFGCDAASQVSFVCVPSSDLGVTDDRLKEFYSLVCKETGLDNAYSYVFGEGDITPRHLGGRGLTSIKLDKKYFFGRKVVIFDDIVTRGATMHKMVSALKDCGAIILFIISLAKTTHQISPHPFDSNKALLWDAAGEANVNSLRD